MTKFSIAVIGPSGFLGKPVLDALQSDLVSDKIEYPIKVLSRSEKTSTEKLKYLKVQWGEDQVPDIANILKGTDVIVELIKPSPDINHLIEEVLKQAKPKLFIPSQFGVEVRKVQTYAPNFLTVKSDHSAAVRKEGIKVVDISTSVFTSMLDIPVAIALAGIDADKKSVTYRGNPDSKFAVSSLEDIGKAVAVIATSEPKSVPDNVRIQSDEITYRDVVARYEKGHNVKLEDAGTISKEQTLKDFQDKIAPGFNGADFLFYLNAIISQGLDKGSSFSSTENELLNPGEKLWKWGKN